MVNILLAVLIALVLSLFLNFCQLIERRNRGRPIPIGQLPNNTRYLVLASDPDNDTFLVIAVNKYSQSSYLGKPIAVCDTGGYLTNVGRSGFTEKRAKKFYFETKDFKPIMVDAALLAEDGKKTAD